MPIEGPIQELGVGDLLQLVALSRRTGSFRASSPRRAEPVTLWIEEGVITGVDGSPEELVFGRLAILRAAVPEKEIERAVSRQELSPSRRIGELLLEQDALDEPAIRELLRFQIDEVLSEMLLWIEGDLSFEDLPPRPAGSVDLHLPIDAVLLDAARRLDELAAIAGLAAGDAIPRLADVESSGAEVSLAGADWEVLAEVDGTRSIQAIARRLGRAQLEVARSLQTMAATRVVELAISQPEPEPPGEAHPRHDDDVRIGLATAALERGELDEVERLLGPLASGESHSAPAYTLRALLADRSGNGPGALELLERAVQVDPLHEDAYFHLASLLIRDGKLARARQEIDNYLELASPEHHLHGRGTKLRAGLVQTLDALGGSA